MPGSLRAFHPDGTMLGFTASATVANTWTASPGSGSRDTLTALLDASACYIGLPRRRIPPCHNA